MDYIVFDTVSDSDILLVIVSLEFKEFFTISV